VSLVLRTCILRCKIVKSFRRCASCSIALRLTMSPRLFAARTIVRGAQGERVSYTAESLAMQGGSHVSAHLRPAAQNFVNIGPSNRFKKASDISSGPFMWSPLTTVQSWLYGVLVAAYSSWCRWNVSHHTRQSSDRTSESAMAPPHLLLIASTYPPLHATCMSTRACLRL